MGTVERILELAKQKGYKQSYIETAIGGYRGKLTEWKNKKSSPNARELEKIAELLGTTVAYLEGKSDDIAPKETSPTDYEAWREALKAIGALNQDGSIDQNRIDAFVEFEKSARKLSPKGDKE